MNLYLEFLKCMLAENIVWYIYNYKLLFTQLLLDDNLYEIHFEFTDHVSKT